MGPVSEAALETHETAGVVEQLAHARRLARLFLIRRAGKAAGAGGPKTVLILIGLLVLTGAAPGIDPVAPRGLHLGWHEVDRAPAEEFEGASHEVSSILAQAGVETAWSRGLDAVGDVQGEIVVVVLEAEARAATTS